jgi:hypothetical protein
MTLGSIAIIYGYKYQQQFEDRSWKESDCGTVQVSEKDAQADWLKD